jgi:uncharacterized protein YgbK (DUF1537 family)
MTDHSTQGLAIPGFAGGSAPFVASDWKSRLAADDRRVIVIDDDPTGTQTASDVDVLLTRSIEAFERWFGSAERSVYALTNSRALRREHAVELIRDLCRTITRAAGARAWTALLRGDSTLRGHVFAELDALGAARAVSLFVPAFPEGGRVTLGGVHYLRTAGGLTNVADSEFARDPIFGYRSRDLGSWVAEMGGGRRAEIIPIEELRSVGPSVVARRLLGAPDGSVVIPDAETARDLESIAIGLLDAESAGRAVLVRSASSFAAVRAGLLGQHVNRVELPFPGRVLVACGSHTAASTAQLNALARGGMPVEIIHKRTTVTRIARERLNQVGVAVIATPRERDPGSDMDAAAAMSARLADVVGDLRGSFEGMIAKGGITSADLATRLGAARARVVGQLEPGVALWRLALGADADLPFGVVPGNVGDESTLVRVVRQFRASLSGRARSGSTARRRA